MAMNRGEKEPSLPLAMENKQHRTENQHTSSLANIYMDDTRLIDEAIVQLNLVEIRQDGVDQRRIEEGKSILNCLPSDLIGLILRLLDPVDYLNFRFVSKTCRSLAPLIVWRKATTYLAYAPPLPAMFIMTHNHQSDIITSYVDSKFGGKYSIKILDPLIGARILCSNNGWFLMSKPRESSCFYNPFTTEIVKIAFPLPRVFSIGFSSSPTCSECRVLAIDDEGVYVFKVGWKKLCMYELEPGYLGENLDSSSYSSVFHNGSFYILASNGSLGVFQVDDDELISFQLLTITEEHWFNSVLQIFLVACDGKLLLVTVDNVAGSVEVFRLNETTVNWEKVSDLGNYTLYICCKSSSFSTPVRADWMRNTIFFPRLHRDKVVYYSMDSGTYHTIANKDETVEYRDTRELPHTSWAGWIEPSWLPTLDNDA